MKKKLAATLSVVLVLGMAVLGILAYLMDTDSDVNVMTLGSVSIEQIEQERDKDGTLKDFTGNDEKETGKPLYPATPGYKGDETEYWSLDKNAVDKIVSVKNIGSSTAYVRTWFAFEAGNNASLIMTNCNDDAWDWNWEIDPVEIDGVYYKLAVATYKSELAATEETPASLLQVALDSGATNADVNAFGDTYEILVFSQAVQTAGFATAQEALDEAFGEISVTSHPWMVTYIENSDQLINTLESMQPGESADIVLSEDIKGKGESIIVKENTTVNIDFNGKTMVNPIAAQPALINNGTLTLSDDTGTGGVVNGNTDAQGSAAVRNFGNLTIESGTYGSDSNRGPAVHNYGTTVINGGTFNSITKVVDTSTSYSYIITNAAGSLTVNDANVDSRGQGVFAVLDGEVVVNGGNYELNGNWCCYFAYVQKHDDTHSGHITFNGGAYRKVHNDHSPSQNRAFYYPPVYTINKEVPGVIDVDWNNVSMWVEDHGYLPTER